MSSSGPAVPCRHGRALVDRRHGAPPVTRAEATRGRLLEASLVVFGRKGVHETRVDDICDAAGVARATFYRHFDGKAEVFAALHSAMSEEILRTARDLEPVGPDVAGLRTLRTFVACLLAMNEHWAPVISSLSAGNDVGPGIRQRSIELTEEFSREVGRRFTEGAVTGVDPAMAALAVVALVEGVGNQLRTWSLDVDRAEVIDLLSMQTLMMLHPGLDVGGMRASVVAG